jgi:hypothetical protein
MISRRIVLFIKLNIYHYEGFIIHLDVQKERKARKMIREDGWKIIKTDKEGGRKE